METGGASAQTHLVGEIQRLREISVHLKCLLLDRFIKEPATEASNKVGGCEPNPIDYCIKVTQECRTIVELCFKLVEDEIVKKLEGK